MVEQILLQEAEAVVGRTDEHQPTNEIRSFEGEIDHRSSSHRRSDHNGGRQLQVGEESGEIRAVAVPIFAVRRSAEAPQIRPHDPPLTGEPVRLRLPHAGVGNPGVNQNERVSRTLINECQPRHVADALSMARTQTYSTHEQSEPVQRCATRRPTREE